MFIFNVKKMHFGKGLWKSTLIIAVLIFLIIKFASKELIELWNAFKC